MYYFEQEKRIFETRQQAHDYMYNLWENGLIPPNFTEDHCFYETAIQHLLKFGVLIMHELW